MNQGYEEEPSGKRKLWIVIAIIAVIVVILATLYVMVIPRPHHCSPMLVGSYTDVGASSITEGYIVFGEFNMPISPGEISLHISVNGTYLEGNLHFTGNNSMELEWANGPEGAIAHYVDYNPPGGEINSGDYIILAGLEPDTMYHVEIIHINAGSTVPMAGELPEFRTSYNSISYYYFEPVDPSTFEYPPKEPTGYEIVIPVLVGVGVMIGVVVIVVHRMD